MVNLKKIGYIWNYFLGEFSYFHRLKSPLNGPDVFAIELTSQCNLRCAMCPHKIMSRPKQNMSLDIFRKTINNVEKYSYFIWLHSMGEPLLNPNLFEMIKYCKSRGIRVGLSTNASLLTEVNAKKLIESGLDKIIMCMESTNKETYERVRIGSKYENVRTNVRRFLDIKKEMRSKTPYTIVQIIQMNETEAEIGAFKKEWGPLCDEVLAKNFSTWANQEGTIPSLSKRQHRYHKILNERFPCQMLWRNVVILSDGMVSPCCIDYDGKIKLGNAAEQDLMQIWRGEASQKLREMHLKNNYSTSICSRCEEWFGEKKGIFYPFDGRFFNKIKKLITKQRVESAAF